MSKICGCVVETTWQERYDADTAALTAERDAATARAEHAEAEAKYQHGEAELWEAVAEGRGVKLSAALMVIERARLALAACPDVPDIETSAPPKAAPSDGE